MLITTTGELLLSKEVDTVFLAFNTPDSIIWMLQWFSSHSSYWFT